MLTCLPQSFCTWNYRVPNTSLGTAKLNFNFFSEQGGIHFDVQNYDVRKHGIASGLWTLETNGRVLADGKKTSLLFRTFEIVAGDRRLALKPQSAFTRCFDILESGRVQGTIRPKHPFTRRAVISCSSDVPEIVQLFCFWLVVVIWRRERNNFNTLDESLLKNGAGHAKD